VVPANSDRVSRARPYSGTCPGRLRVFVYGTLTRCGATFHSLRLTRNFVTPRPAGRRIKTGPTTPVRQRLPPITPHWFGLIPFRSPLLRESRFLSFPRATKMFQFARLPPLPYGFRQEHARITTRRFPHSDIPGSTDGQLLPRAYRSRPRPSSALGAKASTVCPSSLDHEEHLLLPLWSFQGARELRPPKRNRPEDGLSKLNSMRLRAVPDFSLAPRA
jgi:hypothetical protein